MAAPTEYKSAMRGIIFTLQPALSTTGNGNVVLIPSSFHEHRIVIRGSAGIASGAVQIEGANDPDYTGTWGAIGGGPISAVASAELVTNFEGVYNAIRARISTAIVGGTIEVEYVGHP